LERRKITVLGQDVYFKPLTRKALADAMPKDKVERDPDYVGLFVMVACAEAEDGSKLFAMTDIDALRERVSVQLIQEIEQAMMAAVLPSPKEADLALASDPPSASA
jgi:hypothetical protein